MGRLRHGSQQPYDARPCAARLQEGLLDRAWRGWLDPEVAVGQLRHHAAPWRAGQQARLDQEGLVDVLDRLRLLGNGRGDGVQADGPASELVDHRLQDPAVEELEA